MAAAAYFAVGLLPPCAPVFAVAAVLVGAGYGTSGLMVRAPAAGRPEGRLVRYSALNVAVDAGAALGPPAETWPFLHVGREAFLSPPAASRRRCRSSPASPGHLPGPRERDLLRAFR